MCLKIIVLHTVKTLDQRLWAVYAWLALLGVATVFICYFQKPISCCKTAFMLSCVQKKKKIHILLFLTRLQYLSVFWHWMKNILQQSSLAIWIHLYPRLMIWLAVLWCWSLLRMTVKPLEYILFIKSTCVANIIHRDAATPSEQIYKLFNRHGLNI